jgi:hypothetical protein
MPDKNACGTAAGVNGAFTMMKAGCRAGIRHFVPPSLKNIWNQTPGGEFAAIMTADKLRCSFGARGSPVIVRNVED